MVKKPSSRYLFSTVRQRIREHRGRVLNFALGEHAPTPPPGVLELLRSHALLGLRRPDHAELAGYAEAACEMLEREYAVRVSPDSILPTPGGRGAMAALAAALIKPGDGVLVTEPGYPVFARLALQASGRVITAVLDPAREFVPDLRSLSESARASIRLAALNYPNNPTGAAVSDTLTAELSESLPADAVVFNDATYAPLVYDRQPASVLSPLTPPEGTVRVSASPAAASAIELHSLSKVFGLGPLAVSFLAGPPDLLGKVRDFSEFTWSPLSALQLEVSRACFRDAAFLRDARARFGERVRRLIAALEAAGFRPYPTPSGLYVPVRAPAEVGGKPVASAREAAEVLLDEHGLAVVTWDTPLGGYLRFTALYREEDLDRLAELGNGSLVSG